MGLKILAFGEVLWDIINDQAHIGGATLNPAVIVPIWVMNLQLLTP